MEGPCIQLYNRWLILHVYRWMELPNASILAKDIISCTNLFARGLKMSEIFFSVADGRGKIPEVIIWEAAVCLKTYLCYMILFFYYSSSLATLSSLCPAPALSVSVFLPQNHCNIFWSLHFWMFKRHILPLVLHFWPHIVAQCYFFLCWIHSFFRPLFWGAEKQ